MWHGFYALFIRIEALPPFVWAVHSGPPKCSTNTNSGSDFPEPVLPGVRNAQHWDRMPRKRPPHQEGGN